ncbi:1-propanol dehydrogenase PduQ [Cetobacterium sp. SF1]|uniref:1-propanol dehydrogenase PduQ n=1 Tax=unclassified Cetobacterium TaxID=2630983 RepID=UPI003CF43C94
MKRFKVKTEICYGKNSLEVLRELKNRKILIICDKFIGGSDILKKVKENIIDCSVDIFDEVIPDPTVKVVAKGVQFLKDKSADLIIALGGGSSIDGAKAIRDYYGKIEGKCEIEFYAIPTTSGTGSEVTEYSVITNEKENVKYALTDEKLLPSMAILDPELVKSVPKSISADTGMDVLTHAIEAYVSTEASDFTDALAEKAFELVVKNIEKVYKNGEDLEARERMHNGSCLAGLAFNAGGLGLTHSLAHVLGGKYHIPHGKINAMILPHIIRFNSDIENKSYSSETTEVMKKYQKLARIMELNCNSGYIGTTNLINGIVKLQKSLSIPLTLKDLNIDGRELLEEKELERICKKIQGDVCTKTNPREMTREDLVKILKCIMG